MTHDELVEFGRQWAAKQFPVVITELASWAQETPDVLAFGNAGSLLMECKTSRADFRADAKKPWRRIDGRGMGSKRVYLTEKGLLRPDEIPDGWGLYETDGKRMFKTIHPQIVDSDMVAEQRLLISVLRRLGPMAECPVSLKLYTLKTQNTASLTVVEQDV